MLSLVIPTYTINKDLEEQAEVTAASYKEHGADEIIIVEDGGQYSEMLRNIADVYIYSHKNKGFTANVNRGWRLSTEDFTGIVNSDTLWIKGNLKDLCIPDTVTSPNVITGDTGHMAGCFFVVPRTLKEKYGLLNENLKMFASDSDYEWRMFKYLKRIKSVEVYHSVSMTLKAAKISPDVQRNDDEMYYKLCKEGKATPPNPKIPLP